MTLTKTQQDRLRSYARSTFNLMGHLRDVAASISKCVGLSLGVVVLGALMYADPQTVRFSDFLTFMQNGNGVFGKLVLVVTMLLWAIRVICFGVPGLDRTGGAEEDGISAVRASREESREGIQR